MTRPSKDAKAIASWRSGVVARASGLWKSRRQDAALAELAAALSLSPGDVMLTLKQASFLRLLGRAPEAVVILAALREAHPGDLAVALELARAHRDAQDPAASLAMLDAILKADPAHRAALTAKIDLLWATQRRAEALAATEAALALLPSDLALTQKQGGFLRLLGRAPEAVGVLAAVREAHPDDLALALELARAHRDAGDPAASLAVLDAILAADPRHRAALNAKIDLLWASQRRTEALAVTEAALALMPGDPTLTQKQGGFLRLLRRAPEAVTVLAALREAQPADLAVALELARALRDAENPAASLAMLDSILATDPRHRGALTTKIDLLWASERRAEALAVTEAALTLLPGDLTLTHKQGGFLRLLGRAQEAVGVLAALRQAHPADLAVALELARAHRDAGDHAAHLAMLEAILAADPTHRAALNARADMAIDREDIPALIRLCRQAFALVSQPDGAAGAEPLARMLPHLDLSSWNDEMWSWIDAVSRNAAGVGADALWKLYGVADLQGLELHCRRLLAAILDKPVLPEGLAIQFIHRAYHAGDHRWPALASLLRARVPGPAVPRFDLELDAMQHGAAGALRQRRRVANRQPPEILLIFQLLQEAGRREAALRYLALARRFHPDHAQLRRRHLLGLVQSGEAERVRAEISQILQGPQPPSQPDRQAAIAALEELGEAQEALRLIDATEDPKARKQLGSMRFRLLLRFGRLDEAQAMLVERASLGTAKRDMHFGPTLDGLWMTELGLSSTAEAASDDAGRLLRNGQFIGPSLKALDAHLARLPPRGQDSAAGPSHIPRSVVQYWNIGKPPEALEAIMRSWQAAEGFAYQLFDRRAATRFLADELGPDWAAAFRMARHPAEESDFFRLSFLAVRGGIYADCDDLLVGSLDRLTAGASGLVVFREPMGAIANNLILAEPRHHVLAYAAVAAKQALQRRDNDSIWAKTGPGLLTRAIAQACEEAARRGADPGVTILPRHHAARHVQFHIPLPYKKTRAYWNATNVGGLMAGLGGLVGVEAAAAGNAAA